MITNQNDTYDGESLPDNVKKPDHKSDRYYKIVDGKKVFNKARFEADSKFYNKWKKFKDGDLR